MSGRHRWIRQAIRRGLSVEWIRLYPEVQRYWRAQSSLHFYAPKICCRCGAHSVGYQPHPHTRGGEWRAAYRTASGTWISVPPTPGCRGLPDDYDPPLGG